MQIIRLITDTETGGLEVENGLLSIGSVNYANPSQVFYVECRVEDSRTITPQALKVNGFTLEQAHDKGKPSEADAARMFFEFSRECAKPYVGDVRLELGGENPNFDVKFLQAAFRNAGLKWIFEYRTFDLHSIVSGMLDQLNQKYRKSRVPDVIVSTDFAIEFAGLRARQGVHNALEDAKLEAEALSRVTRGIGLLPEFESQPLPDYLNLSVDRDLREKLALAFCEVVRGREDAKTEKRGTIFPM